MNPPEQYQSLNLFDNDLYASRITKPPTVETGIVVNPKEKTAKKVNKTTKPSTTTTRRNSNKIVFDTTPSATTTNEDMVMEEPSSRPLLTQAYPDDPPIPSHSDVTVLPTAHNSHNTYDTTISNVDSIARVDKPASNTRTRRTSGVPIDSNLHSVHDTTSGVIDNTTKVVKSTRKPSIPLSQKINYNIAKDIFNRKADIDVKDLIVAAPALKRDLIKAVFNVLLNKCPIKINLL